MRFATSLIALASISTFATAFSWSGSDSDSFELQARDAYSLEDTYDLYARDASPEAEAELYEELIRRGKAKEKNVDIKLDKISKNFRQQDQQNAKADACDALNKAGCTHGTITHAWHTSNGEAEEHMRIKPTAGDNAHKGDLHLYRDGRVTQGPGGKITYKRAVQALNLHRRNLIEARNAYAEAYEEFLDLHY